MSSNKFANNPFFNFIRSYSSRHANWPVTKIAVEGAKLWHAMCPTDRKKFVQQAEMTIKKQVRRGSILKKGRGRRRKSACYGSGRRGRSSSCRKRSRSRSKGRRSRSRRKH